MHPEITSNKPGRCPKCGMELEREKGEGRSEKSVSDQMSNAQGQMSNANYLPLAIIIGLILLVSLVISFPISHFSTLISNFMIGFFLVFAGFKLVDLKGFAQGYSTYDLLAKRVFSYGYIYPFIELAFGLTMILRVFEQQVLVVEIIVMTFSGAGVAIKLLKHEKFQCVCLGTFLKIPLTYVTLIEDFGMAALAIFLLFNL